MKNTIVYYYNFIPSNIHQKGKKFIFNAEGVDYIFSPVERSEQDMKFLFELSFYLYQHGIYCHQIISNKDNQFLTFVNGQFYVLLKLFTNSQRKININDINLFNRVVVEEENRNRKLSWYDLWTKKIDYFEYQVNQLGRRYPLIRESFSYFIGLGENAISVIRDVPQTKNRISHIRNSANDTLLEFYNPLNFVVDNKVRDGSEYFKSCLFDFDITTDEILLNIINYIKSNYFTVDECKLFFGRMLYPTHYFDLYEKIIQGEISEKKLLKIIGNIENYEELLRKLYQYFRSIMRFPEIEWLSL